MHEAMAEPAALPPALHLVDCEDSGRADHVAALAAALAQTGQSVMVAGPLNRRQQTQLGRQGVRWARVDMPAERDRLARRAAAGQLARLLGALEPGIVHAHDRAALGLACAALRVSRGEVGPALVASLAQVPLRLTLAERRSWMPRGALRRAAAVLTPSSTDREALLRLCRLPPERAYVVYPALSRPQRPNRAEVGALRHALGLAGHAATVGLITDLRGPETELFLRVAAELVADLPNVEFAVLGEGPGRSAAEALAHQLGIGGAVVFTGRPWNLRQAISALNALVVLGDSASGPLLALSAVGYGLPLVAARVGPLEELLGEMPRTELIPAADAGALTEALRRALHVVGGPGEEEPAPEAGGRALSLHQFLVSKEAWDLDQPWLSGPQRREEDATALEQALHAFRPTAAATRIQDIYRQVLRQTAAPRR